MTEPAMSLGEALPKEQARVRELLCEYVKLGPAGTFGAVMLRAALLEADESAMSGDLVRMIRAYEALKECQ